MLQHRAGLGEEVGSKSNHGPGSLNWGKWITWACVGEETTLEGGDLAYRFLSVLLLSLCSGWPALLVCFTPPTCMQLLSLHVGWEALVTSQEGSDSSLTLWKRTTSLWGASLSTGASNRITCSSRVPDSTQRHLSQCPHSSLLQLLCCGCMHA